MAGVFLSALEKIEEILPMLRMASGNRRNLVSSAD